MFVCVVFLCGVSVSEFVGLVFVCVMFLCGVSVCGVVVSVFVCEVFLCVVFVCAVSWCLWSCVCCVYVICVRCLPAALVTKGTSCQVLDSVAYRLEGLRGSRAWRA